MTQTSTELKQHILDRLKDYDLDGTYGCDLHNEIFNTDYYVVGYYEANKFIESYGGAWKAIHRVKNYEKEMFGECSTDLSDVEKIANMLAYIEGEVFLFELKHLNNVWDSRLTTEDIDILIQELEDNF